MASVNFNVLRNPQLASFSDFIFGKGLGYTIGIIIPIIPVIYQFASHQKEDHLRRLEDQADWVKKYYKYLIDLSSSSLNLHSIFEGANNRFEYKGADYYDPYEILYYIIQYTKSLREFRNSVGYLYFQNFWLENFLYNLSYRIYKHNNPIDTQRLRKFDKFFDYTVQELKSDKDSEPYAEQIKKWLSDENKVKDFYLNHLANRIILYVEGTRGLSIVSPSPSLQKRAMDMIMSLYKSELDPHIHKLNRYFYGAKTEAYYDLYDQRSHKILSIFNRYKH